MSKCLLIKQFSVTSIYPMVNPCHFLRLPIQYQRDWNLLPANDYSWTNCIPNDIETPKPLFHSWPIKSLANETKLYMASPINKETHLALDSYQQHDWMLHSHLWYSDGVSNHQPHDCLLNRSFTHRSKKTSKLRVTGLCAGNSPLTG